jgi:integrase
VVALEGWLLAAAITAGPLFRRVSWKVELGERGLTPREVARIVKRAAAAAGLDPSRYAGHSLSAGLATAAARAGKSERAIMRQTGHRSITAMRRYIREGELFADDNAARGLLGAVAPARETTGSCPSLATASLPALLPGKPLSSQY